MTLFLDGPVYWIVPEVKLETGPNIRHFSSNRVSAMEVLFHLPFDLTSKTCRSLPSSQFQSTNKTSFLLKLTKKQSTDFTLCGGSSRMLCSVTSDNETQLYKVYCFPQSTERSLLSFWKIKIIFVLCQLQIWVLTSNVFVVLYSYTKNYKLLAEIQQRLMVKKIKKITTFDCLQQVFGFQLCTSKIMSDQAK